MVTPDAKRNAVAHAQECHGLSERRACDLMGIARRAARYPPSRADDAGPRGLGAEPQEAAEDLSRGRAQGPPPRRPEAVAGHAPNPVAITSTISHQNREFSV
jgi:hypothetical protein